MKPYALNRFPVFIIGVYITSLFLFEDSKQLYMISNALFFIMVVTSAFNVLRRNTRLCLAEGLLISYVILSGISVLWAWDRQATISDFLRQVLFIIMWFSIVADIRFDYRKIKKVLIWIGVAACMLTIYLLLYYGPSNYISAISTGKRIGEEIIQLNKQGMYSATGVLIFLNLFLYTRKKLSFLGLFLCCISLFGSESRRAFLMLGICFSLSIWISISGKSSISIAIKRFFAVLLLVFIGSYLIQSTTFSNITSRFDELFDTVRNNSDSFSRTLFFAFGIQSFKENPLLGLGSGNSHKVTLAALGWATYLHNNYLEQLVNLGIVGFGIYYGIYVYLIKHIYALLKKHEFVSSTIFVILISQLVSDIAVTSYNVKFTYIVFALAIGCVLFERDYGI